MLERSPGFEDIHARHAKDLQSALLPLECRGVCYRTNGKLLIDHINLSINTAGITVVMGFNGAGKSLLLRLFHGMISPTAGSIQWAGQPLGAAVTRRQAMVFQKPVLLRRSVAGNIDFALSVKGTRNPARRDAILGHAGLLDKADRPARLLSGGEQQRLALARALVGEPDILFLDEPTASLDPPSIAAIEEIVLDAARDGTKVIFVTHDIGQARRLADEIVFLHHGRVVEHAPAEAFFSNPNSAAANAYLDGQLTI